MSRELSAAAVERRQCAVGAGEKRVLPRPAPLPDRLTGRPDTPVDHVSANEAVLAPMVAAGISSLLLVYGITLFTITLSRGQLFLRAVPRSIQLGDNETTALIKQCYGVYGCFAITNEWISLSRPISVLPQSPKTLNVKFCLFTPENPTECQVSYCISSL
ncbi:uncharacterized protein LOC122377168, partial [Amphibalanus amphitrite]|uniref:uncharacterized protein LOC122377168 n=1 Tax=Amphibalanus amphitrite TaxID=1232801 RepID=UPI001C9053CE